MLVLSLKSTIINDNFIRIFMPIPKATRDYIESLVDYYVAEAPSYKQIAQTFTPEIADMNDATFGIIVGAIYSGFLQTYTAQRQKVSIEDINEFNEIIKRRAPVIKNAVVGAKI